MVFSRLMSFFAKFETAPTGRADAVCPEGLYSKGSDRRIIVDG
jgi:hypothetical protein